MRAKTYTYFPQQKVIPRLKSVYLNNMAEGDVPLVTSFGGSEIEFGANGTKMTRANSRFVFFFILIFVFGLYCTFFYCVIFL